MIVLKPVRIDLARPARTVVHCMQTDNTQRVDVSLFVNNRPYDVTADVASGETVTMAVAYILPNGYGDQYTETALGETAVEQDSTIAHLYRVMIDGACTDVVGFVQIIVKFTTDGGQILNSFPLTLDVIKSKPDDVDPDGGSPATSRYLRKDLQTPATEDMTQPVGVTSDGLLVTAPGGGGGGGGVSDPVRYNTQQNLTDPQKARARSNIGAGTGTYSMPSGGIPKTDLASAVQTSLGKADTAVQPAALASYVPRAQQAAKVSNQTQAVGIDSDGKLWVQPPGSGGGAEIYYVNITASGNGYVSDKTFAEISAADAAGNLIVPRYNYFEGRMVKLTDEYAALSIIDLAIPEIPILRTFTVTASGTTGTGIDIGGAAYIYLVKNGDDYDIDTTNTPAILQTRGNVLNYFYDGIAVKLMYNGYAHPLVYHYGDGILKFGGPEYAGVNGHHVQQDVVYTWSASSHVAREVVTPLNADLLTERTAAMTQAVGYRSSDGTLWTIPGGGGGGGISKTVVTISGSTCDTSLADIIAAYQNGNVIECWADGLQCWLGYPPNEFGATFFGIDSDSGNTLYAYALAPNGTVTVVPSTIGNAYAPNQVPLTGATPTIVLAGDNTIYTGGTLTSLTVTQIVSNGMFTLIFDSGSSPTSLNLPVYDSAHPTNNYVNWGDFTVEANKHYEVSVNVINGVGYLVGKGW